MPDQADRQRAAQAIDEFVDEVADTAIQACAILGIRPLLTGLSIVDGALGAAPNQWTTVDAARRVQVLATTNPDRVGAANDITWDGAGVTVAPWRRDISRAAVGNFVTGATLNNPRLQVQVAVWDLTNAVSDLPLAHAGTTRKGYAGYVPGDTATLTATTNPDQLLVWQNLNWSTGATGHQCPVNVSAVGDQTITVTLGTAAIGQLTRQVVLHICQWPVLEVTEITFSHGHVINQDTVADFDRLWTRARMGAVAPNPINPPECYTRAASIGLSVKLRVVTPPTDTETVIVRGRATIGGAAMTWTSGNITVNAGDLEVSFPAVDANQPLPNQVNFYPAAQIDWEMSDPNGGWIVIGSTTHDIYLTLGNPAGGPVYWTLLHHSCVNAAATAAEAAFVDAAFTSYTGRNMQRRRDPKPMTYWDPQNVAGGNGNTAMLLGSDTTRENPLLPGPPDPGGQPVAAGHCGSWAESFVDMLKMHGVTSGHKVNVTRSAPMRRVGGLPAATGGFLVAAWNFTAVPAVLADRLTHAQWVTCTTAVHAPGQSNLAPPPAFYNHFIVWNTVTNTLYDPSYGTHFHGAGQAATLLAWEMGSISGLFADGMVPNSGFVTVGGGVPGRRLRFQDQVTMADL